MEMFKKIQKRQVTFALIVAHDGKDGIGMKDGSIPWNFPVDRAFFADMTTRSKVGTKNVLIMGRKTWDSLPLAIRPLKNRITIILSETLKDSFVPVSETGGSAYVASSIEHCLNLCLTFAKVKTIDRIFICGGKQVYESFLQLDNEFRFNSDQYTTVIHQDYHCDVRCEDVALDCTDCWMNRVSEREYMKEGIHLSFIHHSRFKRESVHGEFQYLNILCKLLELYAANKLRQTRNARTVSLFGETMRFDLKQGFPLYTTKKMAFRSVVEETLFFLRGETDTRILEAKGINIWKENTSESFIASRNLSYPAGQMGKMYGFQWRNQGGTLGGKDGIDQFANCLHLLKTDPFSRRILISSYNPSDVDEGVLYPCHGLTIQFYVTDEHALCCSTYIRSNDWCVGQPFNVVNYALLVHIMVYLLNNQGCSFTVGDLILNIGDVHMYEDHYDHAFIQSLREPYIFPSLCMTGEKRAVEELTFEDFELSNYHSYPPLKFSMHA